MYKIKETTDKRFCLAWTDIPVEANRTWLPTGSFGHNAVRKEIIAGFGSIKTALRFLNGEFDLPDKPQRIPELAGVEGGPLLGLSYWFV